MKRRGPSGVGLDALKCFLYVLIRIPQSDGSAVRTCGRMLGFCESDEEPVDFGGVKRLVDLDRSVAGDAGCDAAAASLGVLGLLIAVGDSEDFFDHLLELLAFETYGRGLDGEGAGTKGLGFEAVAVEFLGDFGEGDHLGGEKVDQQGHEEALTLHLLGVAIAQDFFEEDAFVGYVLVDEPEALFVGGEDERVPQLAEGFEGGERGEGIGLLRGGGFVSGFGLGVVGFVAYRDGMAREGEAPGRWRDDGSGNAEGWGFY